MDADLALASRLSEDEVRSRFAWGVKHATPFWLWPAISIPKWQAALFEIERATRQILSHGRCDDALHGEAEDIGIAAYTSGMGLLLGYWLSTGLLSAPQATEAVLKLHYRHNSARMQRLARQASRAVAQLTAGGVKVTVVKGMHTAFSFFPTPGSRPTSDIDLIIAPEDKAAAQRILRELAYLPEREFTLPDEQFWRHRSLCVVPQSLSLTHWDDPWGIGESKLSTWIFAIAYRKAMRALRRYDAPIEDHDAENRASQDDSPEEAFGRTRLHRLLRDAMAELSPDQRGVVELTYFQDLSCREIAEIMDCPLFR